MELCLQCAICAALGPLSGTPATSALVPRWHTRSTARPRSDIDWPGPCPNACRLVHPATPAPRASTARPAAVDRDVSAGVLIAGGGAAVAAGVDPWSLLPTDSPTALFVFNPAVPNAPPPGFTGTTYPAVPNPPTPVIASSVSDIGTVNIARVGRFQYWVARTQNGWWCQASRAPDGTWAGTTDGTVPTYSFGGEVPGGPRVPNGSPFASLQEGFNPEQTRSRLLVQRSTPAPSSLRTYDNLAASR